MDNSLSQTTRLWVLVSAIQFISQMINFFVVCCFVNPGSDPSTDPGSDPGFILSLSRRFCFEHSSANSIFKIVFNIYLFVLIPWLYLNFEIYYWSVSSLVPLKLCLDI